MPPLTLPRESHRHGSILRVQRREQWPFGAVGNMGIKAEAGERPLL